MTYYIEITNKDNNVNFGYYKINEEQYNFIEKISYKAKTEEAKLAFPVSLKNKDLISNFSLYYYHIEIIENDTFKCLNTITYFNIKTHKEKEYIYLITNDTSNLYLDNIEVKSIKSTYNFYEIRNETNLDIFTDDDNIICFELKFQNSFDYFELKAEDNITFNIFTKNEFIFNLTNLKKDIEYYINFHETYKVKLEPGFNAQIILTNGLTTYIINDKNATTEITGNGFRIKSDNDAMVYFFAKIQVEHIKQIKIENREGKYVKISNISLSDYTEITIDFGFEGFLPSSFPLDASYTNGTIYLDNLYNKMKKKLVKDEYLYIYYYWNINQKFVIEYLDNNLNIKNNDFNILFIPKNEGLTGAKNVLLINAFGLFDAINYIHFCFPDTFISFDLENKYHQRFNNQNNDKHLKFELELFDGNNKLEFNTNQSFVFSYSFFDILDDGFFNDNQKWKNERKVLEDLTIIEACAKNNDNKIINIRFKPNYRNSSTRYIIVIAKKNEKNTLNNFNNPCYIAELLNQRPKEIIVDTIYDIGDNDLIYAEVDISSIIGLNKIQYF
jgi:hypothetical protein